MKKSLKSYISLFLLLIISVFIVPKELIHSFADHTDTIHAHEHSHDKAEKHIEIPHVHCEILDLHIPSYFAPHLEIYFDQVIASHFFIEKNYNLYFSQLFNVSALRGPPFLS